jgi:ABC-2 type transport system ATP-binding protein
VSTATPPLAVEAQDIVRTYGDRRALDGLTLTVAAGAVFGLLGPNGSGKSTFVSMLAAMETPAQGTLRVFGEAPSARVRARIGTVFQENAQDPLLSVREYLVLSGRLFGVSRGDLKLRIPEILGSFGLAERTNDAISSLSGGMRRRLDMARALLHNPDLLILDEPTTGVDPDERRALWGALLGKERGHRTILLATNDLSEADTVCDQVAFLRDGRVVASGAPDDLKRGLRREAVQVEWTADGAQLEELTRWPGVGEVSAAGGTLHVTVDDAATFVPKLFALAPGSIRSVTVHPATLEDAYFRHVGRRTAPSGAPA